MLIALLRLYKKYISPVLPANTCRFYPTCSTYTIDALKKYGPIKGSYFSIKRLFRCHPFHPGGYDPVP